MDRPLVCVQQNDSSSVTDTTVAQHNKRVHTSKPKVKTGCITCKVKCDEAKPACQKCTSTGRKCDGYNINNSRQPVVEELRWVTQSKSIALVAANPAASFTGSDEERRCFDYFGSRTSLQLSGFFDSGFWRKIVMQAAHNEPAIRHAVLALSALHERYESGDRSVMTRFWDFHEGGFALQQYNSAIQQLVQPARRAKHSVDICLIACMLFASFETLRGHHGSALSHIRSGVSILSEIQSNEDGRPSHESLRISVYPFAELSLLEVLFNRLDSQVAQMIGTPPMALGRISKDPPIGFSSKIPKVFSCLEEARNSFDYNWNACVHLFNAIGDPPNMDKLEECRGDRHRYLLLFHEWETAFEQFLRDNWDALDKDGKSGARVMQMMIVFAFTCIDSCSLDYNKETIWDRYLGYYKRGVDLAETILESNKSASPYFCLEMNLVAPLYAMAHKCRDPKVRRKAANLLQTSARREGIWDSILAGRVASRLISIEEEGLGEVTCCEDVPDWARLSAVEVKFDYEGRLATVKYTRTTEPKEKVKRQDFMEVVTW